MRFNTLSLSRGSRHLARTGDRNTPLALAAQRGHDAVARELITAGAGALTANKAECSPLTITAQYGHVGVVRELVSAGANVEVSGDGWTPLIAAAQEGTVELHNEARCDAAHPGMLEYEVV